MRVPELGTSLVVTVALPAVELPAPVVALVASLQREQQLEEERRLREGREDSPLARMHPAHRRASSRVDRWPVARGVAGASLRHSQ